MKRNFVVVSSSSSVAVSFPDDKYDKAAAARANAKWIETNGTNIPITSRIVLQNSENKTLPYFKTDGAFKQRALGTARWALELKY